MQEIDAPCHSVFEIPLQLLSGAERSICLGVSCTKEAKGGVCLTLLQARDSVRIPFCHTQYQQKELDAKRS